MIVEVRLMREEDGTVILQSTHILRPNYGSAGWKADPNFWLVDGKDLVSGYEIRLLGKREE